MWIQAPAFLLAAILIVILLSRRWSTSANGGARSRADASELREIHQSNNGTSILEWATIQRCMENGAPPTPWMLRREDREAMATLEKFFARAIPNPEPDGRAHVEETLGHGGPQLELRVPILSTHRPVAVLARGWDHVSQALESNLYFFGATDGRLEKLITSLGFECKGSSTEFMLFRNRHEFARRRSA